MAAVTPLGRPSIDADPRTTERQPPPPRRRISAHRRERPPARAAGTLRSRTSRTRPERTAPERSNPRPGGGTTTPRHRPTPARNAPQEPPSGPPHWESQQNLSFVKARGLPGAGAENHQTGATTASPRHPGATADPPTPARRDNKTQILFICPRTWWPVGGGRSDRLSVMQEVL